MSTLKLFRTIYFVCIAGITVAACFYISIGAAIAGLVIGMLFFGVAWSYKFEKNEKEVSTGSGALIYIYIIHSLCFLAIAYFNYAMVYLYRDGIENRGVITKVEVDFSTSPDRAPVLDYHCRISNFPGRHPCSKFIKEGDSVYYLYSPALPNSPPVIYKRPKPRLSILIDHGGPMFLASAIFIFSLLSVWLYTVYRTGLPQVKKKIEIEKDKERKLELEKGTAAEVVAAGKRPVVDIIYLLFYIVSFSIFSLFILALLKNLYINIPFRFWSVGLTSLALVIILLTNWGEKLFELSNNIMFSLRHYKLLSYLKQTIKILAYISLGKILYASLITGDKSLSDACIDFGNKYFDINFKTVRDFFGF
ncbi:MAG: hypothetical protein ABL876_04590 [Chitinophagaceae bacterium]